MNADTLFDADVCLLLEGTYPFVRGGVSEWVHQLIQGLPELRFSLVHLGASPTPAQQPRYELPRNVVRLRCHALGGGEATVPPRPVPPVPMDAQRALHRWLREPGAAAAPPCLRGALLAEDLPDHALMPAFLHGEEAWQEIVSAYEERHPGSPFLDYLWTVRNTHMPLLRLVAIARHLESAAVYHAVSTGYAGLLGALLRHRTGRPLVLTEHGIYTKERSIELRALQLRSRASRGAHAAPGLSRETHQLWVRLFEGIGRIVYDAADPIITLHEKNRQRQVADGAPAARTRVIPNGVDLDRFRGLRALRPSDPPPVIGLIGRVVPIKDIKTFIRAIGILAGRMPQVQGWLVGPEDEDPAYAQACRELVQALGLEAHVRFLGFRRVEEVLPQLGLLALTSISEAFPLAIVESQASGLPVVATDVGACRELVEGGDAQDRRLGAAGAVVPIVDPEAFADAAQALLADAGRWHAAQQAGIARVESRYPQSRVIDAYRSIYRDGGAA